MTHSFRTHTRARRGLSLLETLLALGIAALVIVGATAFFGSSSTSLRVTETRTEVIAVAAAVEETLTSLGIASLTTEMVARRMPQAMLVDGALHHPFGGEIRIGSRDGGTAYQIGLYGLPQAACVQMLLGGLRYGPTIIGIQANDSPIYTAIPDDPGAHCGTGETNNIRLVGR